MPWLILFIAGLFEIAWAVGLKYTQGLTRLWPTLGTVLAMLASFWFLAQAVRTLQLGTAYAVWTGMGVIGTTICGMILFDEPRDTVRIACIAMIVAGIVGLKLVSTSQPAA